MTGLNIMAFQCQVFSASCKQHKLVNSSWGWRFGFSRALDPLSSQGVAVMHRELFFFQQPVNNNKRRRMTAWMKLFERGSCPELLVLDFIHLSWTWLMIVFWGVAHRASSRQVSQQEKRRYITYSRYIVAGCVWCRWRDVTSAVPRLCVVLTFDRRIIVSAMWWCSTRDAEAGSRCEWHLARRLRCAQLL